MKLYAWQPNGHGELSWFVMAENEGDAKAAVEKEIARRKALPLGEIDRITDYECGGWATDYYTLTVAEAGTVLAKALHMGANAKVSGAGTASAGLPG